MTGSSTTGQQHPRHASTHPPNRWLVLLVLCLSVVLVSVDNMIVNVALPTLTRELEATTSQLQWVVDGYTLAFAGLLLICGHLGDRVGRKRIMQLGLLAFAAASAWAAWSTSVEMLITARVAMGVAAAFVYPSTLALVTVVFPDRRERASAIGIWAGVAGLSIALGPVIGGALLNHFWWGSIFTVNLPVVAIALICGAILLPESHERIHGRFDALGGLLSIIAIGSLVWTIIEAPQHGWTSALTIGGFTTSAFALVAFVLIESRHPFPLLDVRLFRNMRFTASSVVLSIAFFALFGFIFVITLYFQLIRGWDPLQAGLATLPYALVMGALSPVAMVVAAKLGTKVVASGGMALMAAGLVVASTADTDSDYWQVIVVSMVLMASGMALATAPATDAIMAAVPPRRAGLGSAVNDTTREVGGALGVAVVGSVMSSVFADRLRDGWSNLSLDESIIGPAEDSLGAALVIAQQLPDQLAGQALEQAEQAFLDGMSYGALVAAGAALLSALLALLFLPSRDLAPVEPDAVAMKEDSLPVEPDGPTSA